MRLQNFRVGRYKIGLGGVCRATVRYLHLAGPTERSDRQTEWQLREYNDHFSSEYYWSKQKAISELSPLAWVYTRHDGHYKLRCWQKGLLEISPKKGKWEINFLHVKTFPSLTILVGKPLTQLGTSVSEHDQISEELQALGAKSSLSEVIKEADNFARNRLMAGEEWKLRRATAKQSTPIYAMQLDILGRKLGISSEIGRHALGKDKIQVRSWLGVSDQTALRNLTVPEAYDLMVQLWGRAEKSFRIESKKRGLRGVVTKKPTKKKAHHVQSLKKRKTQKAHKYKHMRVGPPEICIDTNV